MVVHNYIAYFCKEISSKNVAHMQSKEEKYVEIIQSSGWLCPRLWMVTGMKKW